MKAASPFSMLLLIVGGVLQLPFFLPVVQADDSIAYTLFKSIATGAASKLGGTAMGWVLGAIGLADSSSTTQQEELDQLKEINAKLTEIEDTLKDVDAELLVINTELNQIDCDQNFANVIQALSLIDTYYKYYQNFLNTANGSNGATQAVPAIDCSSASSCMSAWTETVLDASDGISYQLSVIHNALVAISPAKGILQSCLGNTFIPAPTAYSFESDYYDQAYNVMNKYYIEQAKGLLMLVEAYHFQAWDAEGRPSLNATNYDEICLNASTSLGITACNNAMFAVDDLYDNLKAQFAIVGVPYSDDDVIAHYESPTDLNVYPRSLENFTYASETAGGTHCAQPLLSSTAPPCGITTTPDQMGSVRFSSYTEWTQADCGDLTALLYNQESTLSPGEYLNSVGFYNSGGKIILTSTYDSASIGYLGISAHCFVDTDLSRDVWGAQPFAGQDVVSTLLATSANGVSNGCNTAVWSPAPSLPYRAGYNKFGTDYSFYSASCISMDFVDITTGAVSCSTSCGSEPMYMKWTQTPRLTYQYNQFTMPRIVASDLPCTADSNGLMRSRYNVGGAFSRCGDDFDDYLELYLLPTPASYGGTMLLGDAAPPSGEDLVGDGELPGPKTDNGDDDNDAVLFVVTALAAAFLGGGIVFLVMYATRQNKEASKDESSPKRQAANEGGANGDKPSPVEQAVEVEDDRV